MNLEETFHRMLDARQPDLAGSEQTWDRRADEVSTFTVPQDDATLRMVRQHLDLQGKSVLDISFGAGRYLLEFLRSGARVSGVEISARMLAHAQHKLLTSGQPYTPDSLVHSAWETLDLQARGWEKAFDLVFLHMSPAISSVAMLQKVLRASRHAVCITLYVQREDSLLLNLMTGFGLLQGSAGIKTADDLYAIFNLLYLWGYLPHLQFEERTRTRQHEPDHIFERYANWLWRGAECTEVRRKALKDTLHRRAVDGKIETTSRDIIGHLFVDTTCMVPAAQVRP